MKNSGCLILRPKLVLELLNWLLKFFLCNPEVRLKKGKKEVRLLVWQILIDLTWGIVILSYFLYFYILNIVFFRIHSFTNLYTL